MAQQEIEIILARQLASYLSTPFFLVDPAGDLIFYNEAAETVLGRRFSETGALGVEGGSRDWRPSDESGKLLPADQLPLVVALRDKHPASSDFWIVGPDGVRRHIDVHAFPLIGIAGGFVGGVALFWEMAS